MALLGGPYEILDLADGEAVTIAVERYEAGEAPITDLTTNQRKVVPALRLHLKPGYKKFGPAYWDTTSLTLQAQLRPWLDNPSTRGHKMIITAMGVRPSKRFRLDILGVE